MSKPTTTDLQIELDELRTLHDEHIMRLANVIDQHLQILQRQIREIQARLGIDPPPED